ncbi:MAG: Sua5/YciO/YrdC/YwlC family protein [Candidatus Muirbacterium halophilum]|nr:Sua5/YciO/YrdC/YwlC family protein [Candidatus Muirbacterium halophilum]MCK9477242.1 Sua5/YciO/YrdC/YwlC family protein [Candidatus Muirbacterium halophilum]
MTEIYDFSKEIPIMEKNNILNIAYDLILKDEIIGISTDTVFGLAFNSKSKIALNKVKDIKKRENDIFTYHIGDIKQLYNSNIKFDLKILELLEIILPAPITFIIEGNNNGFKKFYGIRFPKNKLSKEFFSLFKFPSIVATSCNLTGIQPLNKQNEIISFLNNKIPTILFDENSLKDKEASTIIKIDSDYKIQLIREGKVAFSDISKIIIDFLG